MATPPKTELTRTDLTELERCAAELDHAKDAMNRIMQLPVLTDRPDSQEDSRYVKKTLLHCIGALRVILHPPKQHVEGPTQPSED